LRVSQSAAIGDEVWNREVDIRSKRRCDDIKMVLFISDAIAIVLCDILTELPGD
jgi:hypothetical protein